MEIYNNKIAQLDSSSVGKGFARTESTRIASEDYLNPNGHGKGFAKTYSTGAAK